MINTTDCSCKKYDRAACGCSADGNNGCSCSDGLQPSSKGARVRTSGIQRTVIDGPFAETKELLAGYSINQVKSKKEQELRAPECGCENPCNCNGCGCCSETN